MRRRVVCSIGSTDPTAGAGLFLDAAVYARIGRVTPVYVVAGVTAQNSRRVTDVIAVPSGAVVAQLEVILEHVRPDAIRIGLVPRRSACIALADRLRRLSRKPPIIIDPVLSASSGARLVKSRGTGGLDALMRVADIATPNAMEAGALASMRVVDLEDASSAALLLAKRYGCAVLVTGGHLRTGDRVVDVLATPDGAVESFAGARLKIDARGTGCILAASLAVALGRGDDLSDAVRFARRFVRRALSSSRPLGRGRRQFDAAGVGRATV